MECTSARLSIAADRASALEVPADQLAALRQLPLEAQALFGAYHYRSYHWLVALSDTLADDGLEHHESTDIRDKIGFFSDETIRTSENYVIAHEYVHSWNGKFRRPQGLATRDPQQSLDSELLWVYEGLTRYLQEILVARSGMRTPEQSREYIAWKVGQQDRDRAGRRWRPLVDTAISAQDLYAAPDEWTAHRRSVDFYDESILVWLEVDTILRQQTAGRRSLDDFCRDFFGGADGPPSVKPYTRDDVEAALAKIAPYDWHGFFTTRIYEVATRAPLDGISRAGWKLIYDARPNPFHRARATFNKTIDHTLSVGLLLSPSGVVKDVVIDSASWRGGFGPGMKIVAINGRKFTPEVIEEELNAAKKVTAPIQFAVEHGEEPKTLRVDYHGGVLYAHLERDPSRPDLLTIILAPRRKR